MLPFLTSMLTEGDNQSGCFVRVCGVVVIVGFVIFTAWHLWQTGQFDPQGYGIAGGGLLAGGGAGVGLKSRGDAPIR